MNPTPGNKDSSTTDYKKHATAVCRSAYQLVRHEIIADSQMKNRAVFNCLLGLILIDLSMIR